MPPGEIRLSLCMIVRDEEEALPACLASVRGVVDEIIIVDTGSTDRTVEIAREHGAHVIAFTWVNDFARARNAGLDHARGAWILMLDADESLSDGNAGAIRKLAGGPPEEAYHLIQTSADSSGMGAIRVPIVRLFPNRPDVRFEYPVHEQVNGSLQRAHIPIRDTTIEILHAGYQTRELLREKQERNGRLIEEALRREAQPDPQLRYYYATTLGDRGDWAGAAREYLAARESAGDSRPRLGAAAKLKAAESFVQLGDFASAAALLPSAPDSAHHPLALALGARLAEKRGDAESARRWHETLLAAPDRAHIPPVVLAPLKFAALVFLANFWGERGRRDLGVPVFKLALELQQGRCPDPSAALHARYTEILEPK